MRNIIICKQAIRHWVLTYETALRRFYFGATAENDNFMAKMEKCCFLFAKNDYLIGITSIFFLK